MKTYLTGLLTSLFIFVTPVIPLIWLVLFFVIGDTIIGMYASYKKGTSITSRKLARVITKISVYSIMILLVYGLDILILSTWIETHMLVTKIGTGIVCFIEGFSIDEKIRVINNDKGTIYYIGKVFDFVKGFKSKYNEIINK